MADTLTQTEKRIKDADAARTLHRQFRKDSDQRRLMLAKVVGQLNGGKPFDDSQLVKHGQGWRCNINFRDASSALEQTLVSYWRLLHDTSNLATVTVHDKTPQADTYAAIFEKNFNRFFEDWADSYVRNYLLLSANHLTAGVGAYFWNDQKSPRWEPVKLGDLDTDSRAKADIQSLDVVTIIQPTTVSELWEKIRTPEKQSAATALGWNVVELRKYLWYLVKGDGAAKPSSDDYIEIENEIRNNSLGVSSQHSNLRIVHILVREFDGKISRYILTPDSEKSGYLFDNSSKDNRPEDMRQLLGAIFFEAGNGEFWGVKGFGQKNFQIATVLNRLKSRAVDRTILDGLNFQDKSDGALTQLPVTNIGPFNILPAGLEQIPTYPTGSTILETIAMVETGQNQNNARFRDQSTQIGEANTARQASILATLQSQVDVSNATLYLTQVAKNLFEEQFRRLRLKDSTDPDAKKFFERCKADGMDEKFFHEAEITVRTGSHPGAASLALQGEAAKELVALSGDPNVNTRWAWEKYITATFGASAIDRALNPVDSLGDISAQRLALMENSDFGEGNMLPVDPKDNHAAHIPVHLQPVAIIVDNYEASGQIDPTAVVALQNVMPHLEAHFKYLKTDQTRKAVFQELWPQYTDIRNGALAILKQVERMANDAAAGKAQPGAAAGPGGVNPEAAVGAAR